MNYLLETPLYEKKKKKKKKKEKAINSFYLIELVDQTDSKRWLDTGRY